MIYFEKPGKANSDAAVAAALEAAALLENR